MTTQELKAQVEALRAYLKARSRAGVVFSEEGPPNMGIIDAIVRTLETQERRIAAIEQRSAAADRT